MMRSLNTAGTGMAAQQQNLDTIANNLANVNTTGFKAQRAEFQDMMYQTYRASGAVSGGSDQIPDPTQVGLGTTFTATALDFTQGAPVTTGNPLDLMVSGDGFFKVELPNGTTAYTRDGSFKRDANGALVTSDGYPLSPNITVPAGATSITIAPNGAVSASVPGQTDPQNLGNLTISIFANPGGLTRIGQNLFTAGGASGDAQDKTPGQDGAGQIQQGYLEGSNVQTVTEMVRMITAQRAYELNSKAIQTADQMLSVLNQLKQ